MIKKISNLLVVTLLLGQNVMAGAEEGVLPTNTQAVMLTRRVSPSFEGWERALAESKHSHYFLGMDSVDFSVVEGFRKALRQDHAHMFSFEETPLQRQAVKIFRKFAPGVSIPEQVSPVDIFYACLIHAATLGLGQESGLEKHIFDHLLGNQQYRDFKMVAAQGEIWPLNKRLNKMIDKFLVGRGLIESNGERNREDFFEAIGNTKTRHSFEGSVEYDFLQPFQNNVGPIHIPHIVNAGELGLAFLVKSFIRDVAPIGLAHESAWVHGMPMTPGALAWHDKFHGDVAEESRAFEPWVDQVLSSVSSQGLSVQDFSEKVGPLLTRQYKSVLGMYEYLYQQTTGLLMQGHEEAYKKMLVGFFLAMHESPIFESEMYRTSNPDKVLRLHLNNVREALMGDFSLSNDPLNTDPGTGKTTLTEAEIFQVSLPRIVARLKEEGLGYLVEEWNATKGVSEYSGPKAKDYLNKNIHGVKIRTTPYGTDLDIEFKNGKRFVISHPGNKSIFETNQDHGKLLKFLGVDISHPVLGDDAAENKAVVAAYYKTLKKEFGAVLDFFETTALGMMSPGVLSTIGRPTFASDYFRKSWDNHATIEAILIAMRKEKEAMNGADQKPFWQLS